MISIFGQPGFSSYLKRTLRQRFCTTATPDCFASLRGKTVHLIGTQFGTIKENEKQKEDKESILIAESATIRHPI